jgi:hypothetical protein
MHFGSDKEYNDFEWEDNSVEITEESEGSGGTLENSVSMMSDDDMFLHYKLYEIIFKINSMHRS